MLELRSQVDDMGFRFVPIGTQSLRPLSAPPSAPRSNSPFAFAEALAIVESSSPAHGTNVSESDEGRVWLLRHQGASERSTPPPAAPMSPYQFEEIQQFAQKQPSALRTSTDVQLASRPLDERLVALPWAKEKFPILAELGASMKAAEAG
jgi:hypothetical protein